MRLAIAVPILAGTLCLGCGDRTLPGTPSSSGALVSSADASSATDGSDADGAQRGPAPVPTCTWTHSRCVEAANGAYEGQVLITCDPVSFVGPWTLLLERQINGQFQIVQTQVVQTPGFGATFDDTKGPPTDRVYRVCVADSFGTRCGAPFKNLGTPSCVCEPLDCEVLLACNALVDDGCGGLLPCGDCRGGATCNVRTHSCCPVGQESDGTGGCVCAPTHPCGFPKYWDPSLCMCALPV
jgi:hypothetical protein